jgi:hypothetical protein
MKEVIKDTDEKNCKQKQDRRTQPTGVICSRTIPLTVIAHFVAKINSLKKTINKVKDAETVARLDRITEMEAMRAKNITGGLLFDHVQTAKGVVVCHP